MPAPDLTRSVQFRALELNVTTTTNAGGVSIITGCAVEEMDVSLLEERQYGQPAALVDGIDVGGVWLGARHISIKGEVYGSTKADAFDRLTALENVFLPQSGTFGFYALTFYTLAAGVPTLETIYMRPGGLRYPVSRTRHGVADGIPLALSWAGVGYVKSPSF